VKIVRDHGAKWLPSRHHHALAKLIAFAVCRAARNEASPTVSTRYALAIDRDQSTIENFAIAAWISLTALIETAVLLPFRPWLSLLIALLATPWLLQVPLYTVGIVFANRKLTSAATFMALVIASSFVAMMPAPARFVAWIFFAVLALNATAWVIVQLLRKPMAALEERCGA
jgi:hypothetical protein